MYLEIFLTTVLALAFLLFVLGGKLGSPLLAVMNRWVNLLALASGAAYWDRYSQWSGRPAWVVFVIVVLLWFFVESLLLWVMIAYLSRSKVPLFPRFQVLQTPDGMPIHTGFSRAQAQLEKGGYRPIDWLLLPIAGSYRAWSRVYEKDNIRVQLLLVPQGRRRHQWYCAIQAIDADGVRYVLDNLYLPNAGVFPKNYVYLRKPCLRSLNRLLKRHTGLLPGAAVPFTSPPCEDLNQAQLILEAFNAQGGLLRSQSAPKERGRLTQEGRYRIWKALFLLHYFGLGV